MTIQWLSSKRIEGLDAEKDSLPVNFLENGYSFTALDNPVEYIWIEPNWIQIGGTVPAVAGGWKEIGRLKLGAANNDVSVSITLPDDEKMYYMILGDLHSTGQVRDTLRLNGDIVGNYTARYGENGTEQTNIDQTQINRISSNYTDLSSFNVAYLSNKVGNQKLVYSNNVTQTALGAGVAPDRVLTSGKHNQTANPLDEITFHNVQAGTYAADSELVVLGWDPSDDNTNGFWEELASVNGDGAGGFGTGSFTPRKYLWVQMYLDPSTSAAQFMQYNSDSTTYAYRESNNSATDTTTPNSTNGIQIGATENTPQFVNIFIINNFATEKLTIANTVTQLSAGAVNPPDRRETVGTWDNAATQITSIQLVPNAGDLSSKSIIKVWGHN